MIVDVKEGSIGVNSVVCRLSGPFVKFYDVDCKAKYAEVIVGHSEDQFEVTLYEGERTLRANDTDEPTILLFPRPSDEWDMLVDGGRYSFQICLIRSNVEGEVVWMNDA